MRNKRLAVQENTIMALQAGEQWAFKSVFDQYKTYFLSIANRYASDSQEAEDYVQEGFVRIFKNVNSFAFKGSFEGWMKRILINHCLNGIKRNNVLKNHDEINDFTHESFGSAAVVIDQMSADAIMECMEEMPKGYRTVMNMYVIQGFSHREIGEKLVITESSSRSQLTKARAKLKGMLLEQGLVEDGRLKVA